MTESNALAIRKSRPLADAKSGRNYCLWLLGRREYSRSELLTKLRRRELDEATALAIVEQLAKEGLQSDQRCVEAIQRSAESRGWSKQRILQKLRAQGIETSLISSHELLDSDDENKRSEKLYKTWIAKTDGSPKAKRKVLSRIARRGFPIGHLF